ncbi:IPT/TIG domain-containing protein [Paenibacillus chitinolyticus]|uniref:IPT/TIG domain-containing protein n=1 Tax=Paenibacillus chitinolyticus TaxID=79263 RepID=UPI002DC01A00|nr:IPT/TIG domain-containing protein [Paenibacillus chitinolyticus]MEC0244674.1 IPT/TIG domain-containing protein [Paenibacillus chitinolyticus]
MKKTMVRTINLFLSLLLVFAILPGYSSMASADEIVRVTKTINPTQILEGGESTVTLNIQGSDSVNVVKPNDIILIIDRSGSMDPKNNNGEDKMTNAKNSATGFIDLLDFTKHRVGVVDFASDVKFKDLSSNPADVKSYINGIKASGGTNTKLAIEKARELLRGHRTEAQPVILLLTDGEATEPAPVENARKLALEQANGAKSEGIVFYTIALLKQNENPNTSAPNLLMKDMATTAQHHHFVLGSVGLAEIYRAIVEEIGMASAYDVTVKDTVAPEFEIVPGSYKDNIPQPTVVGNTLTWTFNELKKETLTFNYKIRHKIGERVGHLSVGSADIDVTFKDYLGTPHQTKVPNPSIDVIYPAPQITSLVEDKGLIQGGETVTIHGANFRANPKVTFGNTAVSSVQFIDSTKLIVIAPPGPQGIAEVRVTNTDGQFANYSYNYYANPEIISIVPKQGKLSGGNEVVITGKYFMNGARVKFGEHDATVKAATYEQIKVTAPAGTAAGFVDVSILNPDGTSVTSRDAYEYLEAPVVLGIQPAAGLTTGGDTVTITGEHFKSGVIVKFNQSVVPTEFVSATELRITTPSWAKAENVDVVVMNTDKQEAVLSKGYTYNYPAPIITSVTPNAGPAAGGDFVNITGENFFADSKVLFKDKIVSFTFIDKQHLRVRAPQWTQEEKVDITVKNSDGQSATAKEAYSYTLPEVFELLSVAPNSGLLAGGNTISIQGKNFDNNLSVYLDGAKVTFTLVSSEKINIVAPKRLVTGKVDVKIVDMYKREATLKEAYEYLAPPPPPAPVVTSVDPAEVVRTSGEFMFINGDNFQDGAVLWLNDRKITSISFINSKQLRLRAPGWDKEEFVDVKVVNPDNQSGTLTAGLHFINPPADPAPVIASLSPDTGEMPGGYFVTINGQSFKNGAKVFFGNKEVSVSFLGATQLRVRAPQWEVEATINLKVVNPDGQEVSSPFTYVRPALGPAPEITSVTPEQVLVTGGTFVTINGEHFAAQSVVKIGNQQVVTTFVSDKQLRIRVPVWPRAERVDITVTNVDGQTVTRTGGLEYILPPPAVISSLTPNHMVIDANEFVVIDGANFQTGSKVFFGDKEVVATFISDKQLRMRAPVWSKAETVSIKVVNPDGQATLLQAGFTFDPKPMKPAPTITSISPNSGPKSGGDFTYINGSNFVSGAKVSFNNGAPFDVTFLSANQVRFRAPSSAKLGPVDVKVINPDGQTVTLTGGYTYQ